MMRQAKPLEGLSGQPLPLFAASLLRWFAANAREMPWRSDPTPYHVWISEIMLQQTRVEAVRGYYARFLEAFPTLQALASSDIEQVLKLWEGLGYYSRARNLHKTARLTAEQGLPGDFSALLKLPGIGRYTAGAVASIAFGQPVPAVDGNVLRVITRLAASRQCIDLPATKAAVEEAVREQLPSDRPGDLNQALMELGATVCVPAPRCDSCPLYGLCHARRQGIQEQLPVRAAKRPRNTQRRTVLVLTCQGRVAVRKRPETGLLAGLWEYPAAEGMLTPKQADEWLSARGLTCVSIRPLPAARHVFTHLEWEMQGYLIETAQPGGGYVWTEYPHLNADYAVPTAYRTYTDALREWYRAQDL